MLFARILSAAFASHPIATGLAITSSSAVIYINNNTYIDNMALGVAWYGMRAFTQVQLWCNDALGDCCGLWRDQRDVGRHLDIVLDGKIVKRIPEGEPIEYRGDYDLVMFRYPDPQVDSRPLYRRYNELPTEPIEAKSNYSLFMAASVEFNDTTYAVEDVGLLTIPNTRIFDRCYTQWFMRHFHGVDVLDDEYRVELLDQDMTKIEVAHTQYIELDCSGYRVGPCADTSAWRGILSAHDIPADSPPSSGRTRLAETNSPPLLTRAAKESDAATTPLSLRSDHTEASFDMVDEAEDDS